MEKKYQFFISSTYEDLKDERDAAVYAILTMEQFPIGMEMFSAADDDQWQIIKQAIDSSDFYILIIGNRYGSIEEATGISYTEKEYDYAVKKGIPVFAFIVDESASMTMDKIENDAHKMDRLKLFKEKVKNSGRYVKFWKNRDNIESLISQSVSKAVQRGNRPGWVRTSDFDIEKSYAEILRLTERVHILEALNSDLKKKNNRKPNLLVDIQPIENWSEDRNANRRKVIEGGIHLKIAAIDLSDAEEGIEYKNIGGRICHESREEVRLFRYVYENGFPIYLRVFNNGNARATGVRIKFHFPKELLVLSEKELYEYSHEDDIRFAKDAYEGWNARFYNPVKDTEMLEKEGECISLDELVSVEDIANMLDPAEWDDVISIFPGYVKYNKDEVGHKAYDWIEGIRILPTQKGRFVIQCEIICNEYTDIMKQEIIVEVE